MNGPAQFPQPSDNPITAPFWENARNGMLAFMRCQKCAAAFLPARGHCPSCLTLEPRWEVASGRAKLVSWMVYHRAFHPAFADRLPYTAAIVELEEGPRMISNIVEAGDGTGLKIDSPVDVCFEWEGDLVIPRFRMRLS